MANNRTNLAIGDIIPWTGLQMKVVSLDPVSRFAKLEATDKSELATASLKTIGEILNKHVKNHGL